MESIKSNKSVESLKVSYDIAPDVFEIITRENLAHEITDAESHNSFFRLKLYYDAADGKSKRIIDGIVRLLDEYEYYRHGNYEQLNW